MAQRGTRVLHIYMLCLWLAVVTILLYQGYSLWKVVKYNYGIPNGYGEVYDRKKQCKDTASGQFSIVRHRCVGAIISMLIRSPR